MGPTYSGKYSLPPSGLTLEPASARMLVNVMKAVQIIDCMMFFVTTKPTKSGLFSCYYGKCIEQLFEMMKKNYFGVRV